MEEKLNIKAEICTFLSGDLICDYDDGSFEHFDGNGIEGTRETAYW